MKKIFWALLLLFVLGGVGFFSAKPAVLFFAKKQLKSALQLDSVLIKDCKIKLFHQIRFLDVTLKKDGWGECTAQEVSVQYGLERLLKRKISKVVLKDVFLSADLSKQEMAQLTKNLQSKSTNGFAFEGIELVNGHLQLRALDFKLQAQLTAQIDIIRQFVHFLSLKVDSLEGPNFLMEDAGLDIHPMGLTSKLLIRRIQYQKLQIKDLTAQVRQEGVGVFFDSLAGRVFNGTIGGNLSFSLAKGLRYYMDLKVDNADLAGFVNDFDLKEKVQMSGLAAGRLVVEGQGGNMHVINGDFTVTPPGGILLIKNKALLDQIARNSQQPLEIVVESLQNYHYDNGEVKLSLDQNNLVLDTALDGAAGKRNFYIVYHDFSLGKEGL